MSTLRSLSFIARHPLNRAAPVRALWRFMAWQIATRLNGRPVVVPFVAHTRLVVARGMRGATGNVYCGLHEFEDMGFVLHALRAGDLFVDVGANVGSYTVLAAGASGAQVLAFEPAPRAYAALCDNVRLNNLAPLVEPRCEAVGDRPGRLPLTVDLDTVNHVVAGGAGEAGGTGGADGTSIEVPIVTLDEALGAREPSLIKIDVEGYETSVIDGAQRTLRSPRLLAVLMELNGSGARYGFDEDALHQRMLRYGFTPTRYDPLTRFLRPAEAARVGDNLLYIRDRVALEVRIREAPRREVHGRSI
jgi:FkbM family methyltransferase